MTIDASDLDLPRKAGVYLFRNSEDVVLYVGKASNLSSRVKSYFSNRQDREMIPRLLKNSVKVDFIVTQNPTEALILERQLIREFKPRFNSLLKDDKSFPFIAITSDELPRIMYTRNAPLGAKIWGPFPDAGAAKQVKQLLRRHFGIRNSKNKLPFGFVDSGNKEEYLERVRIVGSILDGDAGIIIESLQANMDNASESLEFERASRFRDKIAILRLIISENVVSSRFYQDCDAVGFSAQGDSGCVVILHAKEGIVQGQINYPLIHRGRVSDSVSMVLSEHYENRKPPRTLLVPIEVGEAMSEWLSNVRGTKVEVRVPKRGRLSKLREMADRNAEIQIIKNSRRGSGNLEEGAANDGAMLLGMASLNHIVCFDMSQNQGRERVGASVVLHNGRPSKSEYRTYRVKGDSIDDLGMMSEVISRWARRQESWPDLLLIDGGETHLSKIISVIEKGGFEGLFEVAALAKKEEKLHMKDKAPIILDRRGRVLIYARDESHRFVNRYHRKRRSKGALEDPLEGIEGLGAKKIQTLLRHFGGIKGIKVASLNELKGVPGIGREMAKRIRIHFDG